MNKVSAAELLPMWGYDALQLKAQRYAEAMLDEERNDWKFGLLSSFALEFLARAALAKVSPTLLADPKDWNNLYHSLGHTPKAKKFIPKSITTAEVFSRLREILDDFDTASEGFCLAHINRRNSELHTGETPFDGVKSSAWIASFYSTCAILLISLGSDLEEFLGDSEARVAKRLIEAARDSAAKSVMGTIKAHETVWNGKTEQERTQLTSQSSLWAAKRLGHRVRCPACKSMSIVSGEPISEPQKTIEEDDLITETQEHLPDKFECIACSMKLLGLAQLAAAGLGDTYKQTSTYHATEYYKSEDEMSGMHYWEDDNNEPF